MAVFFSKVSVIVKQHRFIRWVRCLFNTFKNDQTVWLLGSKIFWGKKRVVAQDFCTLMYKKGKLKYLNKEERICSTRGLLINSHLQSNCKVISGIHSEAHQNVFPSHCAPCSDTFRAGYLVWRWQTCVLVVCNVRECGSVFTAIWKTQINLCIWRWKICIRIQWIPPVNKSAVIIVIWIPGYSPVECQLSDETHCVSSRFCFGPVLMPQTKQVHQQQRGRQQGGDGARYYHIMTVPALKTHAAVSPGIDAQPRQKQRAVNGKPTTARCFFIRFFFFFTKWLLFCLHHVQTLSNNNKVWQLQLLCSCFGQTKSSHIYVCIYSRAFKYLEFKH